ncbi:5869_t:CDS:2, partial [Acaulospora colombiana]
LKRGYIYEIDATLAVVDLTNMVDHGPYTLGTHCIPMGFWRVHPNVAFDWPG